MPHAAPRSRWAWPLVIAALLLLRVPSLAQPIGGDQGLYVYAGQRVLDGGVPYVDAWDQKPPGIMVLYAALWGIWPRESVVAAADLAAAAIVSILLVVIGRRLFGPAAGGLAAAIFLLWGDPTFAGLAGLYVRGQCETFIALAVSTAMVLASAPELTAATPDLKVRPTYRLIAAGVALGIAVWLKYNAIVYLLPVGVAIWAVRRNGRSAGRDLGLVLAGIVAVTAIVLAYFAAHGALADLRLATLDYNVRYSQETYSGPLAVLGYLARLPIARARVDMLWFLGGLGLVALVLAHAFSRQTMVVVSWLAAAGISIAVNGARELPQYFVQAAPALALAAGAGIASLAGRPLLLRLGIGAVMLAGLWRVGADAPGRLGARWGGLPRLVEHARADYAALTGQVDRPTYLTRFRGRKYDAVAIDELARHARETTAPADRVFVFGFSGGVAGALAERASASRFFWSRPVIIEFAADRPRYGSAGLLADLEAHPPALIALQERDWFSRVDPIPDSAVFFMTSPGLRAWLEAGYVPDRNVTGFLVFRRRP